MNFIKFKVFIFSMDFSSDDSFSLSEGGDGEMDDLGKNHKIRFLNI